MKFVLLPVHEMQILYNLALTSSTFFRPTTLILARPLLKHTFPPFTSVTNLTLWNPSESLSPKAQILVTSVSLHHKVSNKTTIR